jgi:hypothetical protein
MAIPINVDLPILHAFDKSIKLRKSCAATIIPAIQDEEESADGEAARNAMVWNRVGTIHTPEFEQNPYNNVITLRSGNSCISSAANRCILRWN